VNDDTIHQPGDSPSPSGVPKHGDVIARKYVVEEVIGTGGMGGVVAARHKQLGERVAVKVLLPKALKDAEAIGRFVREARTQIRIKNEHVVRVLDIDQLDSGAPYILMEYLEGRDLARMLRAEGRLPIPRAIDYVLQACVAIAEAHMLGIVHRDLKPSNLFVTQRSDGTPLVKVLDFGISKALEADLAEPRSAELTDTQAVFGSPAYMSPEQIRSAKNVDYRTDIWSLGVILFESVTGHPPFKAETVSGLLAAIAADPPLSLRDLREEAPPALEEVVARCLTKDVSRRFSTVAELAASLAPLASPESRVYVDRVQRITTASAGSGRIARHRPSVPSSPPAAFAATEKPWTTRPSRPQSTLRGALLLLAAGLAVGVVGMVAVGKYRTKRPENAIPVTVVAASVAPSASMTATMEPPVTAVPAPPPPPPVSASASAPLRPPRAPGTIRPPPRRVSTPPNAPPPPSPPPPTPVPNVVPDPTAESH
jgi:serine/threonine-protein kinase